MERQPEWDQVLVVWAMCFPICWVRPITLVPDPGATVLKRGELIQKQLSDHGSVPTNEVAGQEATSKSLKQLAPAGVKYARAR